MTSGDEVTNDTIMPNVPDVTPPSVPGASPVVNDSFELSVAAGAPSQVMVTVPPIRVDAVPWLGNGVGIGGDGDGAGTRQTFGVVATAMPPLII